jgi:hypothetical protein
VWRRTKPELLVVREDVEAILAVLFDTRRELAKIRQLLEDDDDGSEEEAA